MAKEKEVVMFVVDRNQDLIRIDKFLFDKMPNVTRNKIKDGIKSGKVLVNKGPIKPSYKVKPLDKVKVSLDREKRTDEIKPENIVAKIFLLKIPITIAIIVAKILGLFSSCNKPPLSKNIAGKIIAGKIADGT